MKTPPSHLLAIGQNIKDGTANFEFRKVITRLTTGGGETRDHDLKMLEKICTDNGVDAVPVLKSVAEELHRTSASVMPHESGKGF
jgi:hypothetical protein